MNNRIQNIKVSENWLIIAYNKKNNSPSHSYHRSVVSPPVYVYITYTLHRHTTKIFCNKPVSYTHLDVYKRQGETWTLAKREQETLTRFEGIPVLYTVTCLWLH